MLIRQSKNSFIRIYDNGILGYITNQLTRHDRTYIESGADFLSQITREPKDIESIVADLTKIYDADIETIRTDFMDLAQDLAYHKFVVVGETTDELDAQDLEFSYANGKPKNACRRFYANHW